MCASTRCTWRRTGVRCDRDGGTRQVENSRVGLSRRSCAPLRGAPLPRRRRTEKSRSFTWSGLRRARRDSRADVVRASDGKSESQMARRERMNTPVGPRGQSVLRGGTDCRLATSAPALPSEITARRRLQLAPAIHWPRPAPSEPTAGRPGGLCDEVAVHLIVDRLGDRFGLLGRHPGVGLPPGSVSSCQGRAMEDRHVPWVPPFGNSA